MASNKSMGPNAANKSTQSPSGKKSANESAVQLNPATDSLGSKSEKQTKGRCTFWLIMSVLGVALGSSFIFGYNIGVINIGGAPIKRAIGEQANYTCKGDGCQYVGDPDYEEALIAEDKEKLKATWSIVAGAFPLGAMLGGVTTGFVADRLGRKCGMLLNNILTFIGGGIMFASYYSDVRAVLIAGRFVIGINCGLNSGLAPMYLTEIAPVNYRGLLGSINQLMVTISILVANVVGLPELLGTKTLWKYLLLATVVPSIVQLCILPLCPESPIYLLITKNNREDAKKALVKLRQTDDVDAELNMMQTEADKIKNAPRVTFGDVFKQRLLRWALFIAVMMMLAQQLSGINAVMFFSNDIFKEAGLNHTEATGASLGVMGVNVLMTVVSTFIVDVAGRRTLLIIGQGGMLVSTLALVLSMYLKRKEGINWASYLSIPFVYLFVIFFATGSGSIPWFYVSELFEQGARGHANSVAVGTNWFAAAIVSFAFPPIALHLQHFSFLIFSGCLVIFLLFTIIFVPETKGKSIDQVLQEMEKGKKQAAKK